MVTQGDMRGGGGLSKSDVTSQCPKNEQFFLRIKEYLLIVFVKRARSTEINIRYKFYDIVWLSNDVGKK